MRITSKREQRNEIACLTEDERAREGESIAVVVVR